MGLKFEPHAGRMFRESARVTELELSDYLMTYRSRPFFIYKYIYIYIYLGMKALINIFENRTCSHRKLCIYPLEAFLRGFISWNYQFNNLPVSWAYKVTQIPMQLHSAACFLTMIQHNQACVNDYYQTFNVYLQILLYSWSEINITIFYKLIFNSQSNIIYLSVFRSIYYKCLEYPITKNEKQAEFFAHWAKITFWLIRSQWWISPM
jgi:hypothetical protein